MECDRSAIRAHSIQNARIIDLLAKDGHVIAPRMNITKEGPAVNFELIGRNQASTFTGMCNAHDTEMFSPLESKELNFNDQEQLFLLAHRSATRELHAVMEKIG